MTFNVLLFFKKCEFSSILIFLVYCFVSIILSLPPPDFLFPHTVLGFSGSAVPQELSMWDRVCTYVVLIRIPLIPPGPLTVAGGGLPLKLFLPFFFCYYSWSRTKSHLFSGLVLLEMTGKQKCTFCSGGFYFLWQQRLPQSSWIWPWLCLSLVIQQLCSGLPPLNLQLLWMTLASCTLLLLCSCMRLDSACWP